MTYQTKIPTSLLALTPCFLLHCFAHDDLSKTGLHRRAPNVHRQIQRRQSLKPGAQARCTAAMATWVGKAGGPPLRPPSVRSVSSPPECVRSELKSSLAQRMLQHETKPQQPPLKRIYRHTHTDVHSCFRLHTGSRCYRMARDVVSQRLLLLSLTNPARNIMHVLGWVTICSSHTSEPRLFVFAM